MSNLKTYTLFNKQDPAAQVLLATWQTGSEPEPAETEFRIEGNYADGTWKYSPETDTVIKKSQEEITAFFNRTLPPEPPPSEEQMWNFIRSRRSALLTNSDWIIVKSKEIGSSVPQSWLEYRQALRDITLQPDPFNITWPVKPTI